MQPRESLRSPYSGQYHAGQDRIFELSLLQVVEKEQFEDRYFEVIQLVYSL